MNLSYSCLIVGFALNTFCHAENVQEPNIIPRPQIIDVQKDGPELALGKDSFTVTSDDSPISKKAADFLNAEPLKATVHVHLAQASDIKSEGYRLVISEKGVRIEANDYAGFFNGSRTLAQLLQQAGGGAIPTMTISDSPRFLWRAVMLDVARHYAKPQFIYQLIDTLSSIKINVLHLHLTDDQGWRMEINKYPLLTERGAWRPDVGWKLAPESTDNYREDKSYGGFYSQKQLKEFVAYAQARNITIVPEIDIPGHSMIAKSLYPELLNCDRKKNSNVLCASKTTSYEFVKDVLKEVFEVFPSKSIVIGADEVRLASWQECPGCQKLMKEKGLKDERGLQHLFVGQIAQFCIENGRIPVGWDEMVEGGEVAPEGVVIARFDRSNKPAEMGRDMIVSRTSYCYFDYSQGVGEPLTIGPGPIWEKTYSLEPIPEDLQPEQRKHIIGVEGALWTEYVPNEGHAAYMLFPRSIALAEVGWTEPSRKDEANFRNRLNAFLPGLASKGISYRPDHGLLDIDSKEDVVQLKSRVPDCQIYYTLDGSYPTEKSTRYTEPLPLDGVMNLRIAVVGKNQNRFPIFDRTVGIGPWSIVAPEADSRFPAERMFDQDGNTFYRSKGAFRKGASIRINFEKELKISGIRVLAARGILGGRSNFLAVGRLQYSTDGKDFVDVATFNEGIAEVKGHPMNVRAIRFIADQDVRDGLTVREISLYR